MNTALKDDYISEVEYLNILENSNERYELIDGEMYAMAGGSRNHHRLIRNLSRLIDIHLKDSACEVFAEFMLRMKNKDYFYPDLLVECEGDNNIRGYATDRRICYCATILYRG